MEKGQMKGELKGRYCFICDKAEDILAPFMEIRKQTKKRSKLGYQIDLGKLPHELLIDLEYFLLSDTPYEESSLYRYWDETTNNEEYKKKVLLGKELVKKHNDAMFNPNLEIELDAWTLLLKVRQFIAGQKSDRHNCVEKLHAMEEYFRIARYKNDGHIWRSGYLLRCDDVSQIVKDGFFNSPKESIYEREIGDNGLEYSRMVLYLASESNLNKDNGSILTEKEKQDIYLSHHDELPWDMEAVCAIEDQAIPTLIELEMTRPDNTNPCGKHFYVKEEDIFINPNDRQYRYYMLCPHCGYIVNIPNKEIPQSIKKRIEERCQKDPMLFRKKNLYSELLSLEEDPLVRKRLNAK